MQRSSGEQIKRFSRTVGAIMISCAILFGYGAISDLVAKVRLRVYGEKVPGSITDYRSRLMGAYPVVSYQTHRGETLTATSSEKFLTWAAPPVGSPVEVCYDAHRPTRFHLAFDRGIAQFAWLELPAALAFLFTFLLVTGLRFVLI